jgi:Flp pilus assembly protein TadG
MTRKRESSRRKERGAALLEFAVAGAVFLTALFAVIEFGRLLWVHNALRDTARRGARYAVVRKEGDESAVKKYIVYGDPNADPTTAKPVVDGLNLSQVNVDYANFNGIRLSARATVTITNYKFNFAVPIVGTSINMPNYRTSMTGESAGFVPCDIPNANPAAPCAIVPN